MRYVELCFHEADAGAADLAARGLTEAGVCVLRRPVSLDYTPAVSSATTARVVLHSEALAALPGSHPVFADDAVPSTIDVPLGELWPLRASRPRMVAPPADAQLRGGRFWKVVAWAAAQPIATRDRRIAAQTAIFRSLRDDPGETGVIRRRPRLLDRFVQRPVVAATAGVGWETAAPFAAAATLIVAAGVSAVFLDLHGSEAAASDGSAVATHAVAEDAAFQDRRIQ